MQHIRRIGCGDRKVRIRQFQGDAAESLHQVGGQIVEHLFVKQDEVRFQVGKTELFGEGLCQLFVRDEIRLHADGAETTGAVLQAVDDIGQVFHGQITTFDENRADVFDGHFGISFLCGSFSEIVFNRKAPPIHRGIRLAPAYGVIVLQVRRETRLRLCNTVRCRWHMCRNNRGVAYLAALVAIILLGIALGAASQSWRTVLQREREEELLFRGLQIRNAIAGWYGARPGGHVATPLRDLKDLLRDPRTAETVRHLRTLYVDPMTGGDWLLIEDPVLGIRGVASRSDGRALKISGFPEGLEDFEGKTRYSEWQFLHTSPVQGQATSGTGAATAP